MGAAGRDGEAARILPELARGGGPPEGWWRGTLGRIRTAAARTSARREPLHHACGPSVPLPEQARGEIRRCGLDASWERKLARATLAPDFTLDLHGHTLDQAHRRLDSGLAQAKAMDARLVLLITGKSRPTDAADRGARRGAIRAKVLDWLAAGPHASDIAAIRKRAPPPRGRRCALSGPQAQALKAPQAWMPRPMSNRSAFITLVQALTKSLTNFSWPPFSA